MSHAPHAISHAAGAATADPARPAIPRTMAAARLVAPQTIELQQTPMPSPGRDQVLVRLEGCGVCASNLPPWEGRPWFTYPMEPGQLGHEGWGVIVAVGSDVTQHQPGDRVAILSNHAYAQYDLASQDQVVPLRAIGIGRNHPFPGEPLGCAVNIFRRCDIQPGQSVAIVGIGFLGALLIQLAAGVGARVIAVSRRPFSLEVARRMGVEHVVAMDDHQRVIQQVAELTGGRRGDGDEITGFCPRVIECTGKQWPLQLASELCAVRGRLIIAGYHQDDMRSVNVQLWNWRGLDVINAHERDPAIYIQGIREAAELVEHGTLDPSSLYTHQFPLSRLEEALQITQTRPDGFVKALIDIGGAT